MKPITPQQYKQARLARGTQVEVAKALQVKQSTISWREIGHGEITQETMLALLSLPVFPVKSAGKSKK